MRKKRKEVDFSLNRAESWLIKQIARRANTMQPMTAEEELSLRMDLTAVHCNGNPLRLEDLLRVDDVNFAHDVFGIRRHIDRETGQLTGFFLPRLSSATARRAPRKSEVAHV
jgi:hypothetical protein